MGSITAQSDQLATAADATASSNGDTKPLTEAEVRAKFDALVEMGVIKYDYEFITETHTVDGIDFEFRISKALMNKPWTTTSTIKDGPAKLPPRPGSDINTQGSEVANLGDTHYLAFNGFSSYRPHYLLMTLDGFRRQWEPLDIDDFKAIHAFMDTCGQDSLIFFNCRIEAGCSRVHKHLQAVPRESYGGNPWHNMDKNADSLPFAYFREDLNNKSSPEDSLEAYLRGLEAVERTLGGKMTEEDGAPPHNMLMDAGRIVVVPRRAVGLGPVGANAGGMLGMIWTQSDEMKHKWLETGPHNVMKHAGCPELL